MGLKVGIVFDLSLPYSDLVVETKIDQILNDLEVCYG